ncbi:uncharacterized protein LOC131164103 isoform X2 [Malania oleifera]|nr:uncharacterized protein LOC131164103 isoform X2 [Malania oleifera]
MVIFGLVLPNFHGAFHVYQLLVRPSSLMNVMSVINWFNKQREFHPKEEDFLVAAERYVQKNGSEALENLIAVKVKNRTELAETDNKRCATAEVKESAEPMARAITASKGNFLESQSLKEFPVNDGKFAAVEMEYSGAAAGRNNELPQVGTSEKVQKGDIKNTTGEIKESTKVATGTTVAGGDNQLPGITTSKMVQKEWTCPICQVKTQCEKTLNSHLQGKKHRANYEKLTGKKLEFKDKGSPVPLTKKSDQNKEESKCPPANELGQKKTKEQVGKVQTSGIALHCKVCNINCPSLNHMSSHLKGKKHQAQIQELVGSPVPLEKKSVQSKEVSKKYIPTSELGQKNTKEQVEKVQTSGISEQGEHNSKKSGVDMKEPALHCNVCNIDCLSPNNMNSHLKGKKHQARIQELVQ